MGCFGHGQDWLWPGMEMLQNLKFEIWAKLDIGWADRYLVMECSGQGLSCPLAGLTLVWTSHDLR
jgi:hypothetical protein